MTELLERAIALTFQQAQSSEGFRGRSLFMGKGDQKILCLSR
jgi:hypothetical protein